MAYTGAVSCAVGVSLGLPRLVAKLPLSPKLKGFLTFARYFIILSYYI
jgi:hypothetical protein